MNEQSRKCKKLVAEIILLIVLLIVLLLIFFTPRYDKAAARCQGPRPLESRFVDNKNIQETNE